jgi:hypothetical protein
LYAYVGGNPASLNDPLGWCAEDLAGDEARGEAAAGLFCLEHPIICILGFAGSLAAPVAAEAVFAAAEEAGSVDVAVDANKLSHIFDNPAHDLDTVVEQLGSQGNAYAAIQSAAEAAVNSGNLTGVFETVVDVAGTQVTVRGAVVNGAVRIGTAFVK